MTKNKFELSRETKLFIYQNINTQKYRYSNLDIPYIMGELEISFFNSPFYIEISNWLEKQHEGWYDDIPDYFKIDIGPYIGMIPTENTIFDLKGFSKFIFHIDKFDKSKDNWKAWFL